MKKIIIPVIIAAVLGVGSGVTAVLVSRSNMAAANDNQGDFVELEIKSGIYYLNGDKNAELWVEATPDHLVLKGNDVERSMTDAIIKVFEEDSNPITDEAFNTTFEDAKMVYGTEKIYAVQYIGMESFPYWIHVSRDNSEKDRSELVENFGRTAVFPYDDKTNTIKLGLFGDFTLVE